jgi:hypothetical protein
VALRKLTQPGGIPSDAGALGNATVEGPGLN